MGINENTLEEIKNGNVVAFKNLFDSLYNSLYFYCRKMIADPQDAKDLLQNVFLRLWEKRDEIDVHVSLNSYIFRSVHNECLNYLRRSRMESMSEDIIDYIEYGEEMNNSDDPYSKVLVNEIETMLGDSVSSLPEQCRAIFVMSRYEGMPNKEIAMRMDISVRTVETQIYRALKILKNRLKEYLS